MDPYSIIGMVGVALYLGSYAALQVGILKGAGYMFSFLNLTAATCVLVSLMEAFNMSSAIIQTAYIVISIIGIIRLYIISNRLKFTAEEEEFCGRVMPLVSKLEMRRFLDNGFWIDGETGTILTDEGKPVDHLVYLARGGADVIVGGNKIATVGADSFIGEITCLTGEPASGTVVVNKPSRYFCFEASSLRHFLTRNPEINSELEKSFAKHLRRKLVARNQTVTEALVSDSGGEPIPG